MRPKFECAAKILKGAGMSFGTILAPIGDVENGSPALELAFSVGRAFGAHVDVLHVSADPRQVIPYVGEGLSGALIDEVVAAAAIDSGERQQGVRGLFDRLVEARMAPIASTTPQPGFSVAWREDAGREDARAAAWARAADLAVAPRPRAESEAATTALFEALVFEGGLPVLLAPPGWKGEAEIGKRILIGWNGGAEAAGAIGAAMPFLEKAEAVKAVSMTGWLDGPASLDRVTERLAWRGIASTSEVIDASGPKGIGNALMKAADDMDADLIVMGAYTQSRLRQMILGGVTRYAVSNATRPLLLAR